MLGFVPQPNLQARLRGDAHVGFCTSTQPTNLLQVYYKLPNNEIPKANKSVVYFLIRNTYNLV